VTQVQRFNSASGLRPAGAFFALAAFLALAGVWVGRVALGESEPRKSWEQKEVEPAPAFTVVDRDERPLALFVQRLDLVLSPNAAWQAHTPRRLAERIHAVLQPDCDVETLLERMLPDARNGVATMKLVLDLDQAARIQRWLLCGSPDGPGDLPPIESMWVEAEGSHYVLRWRPDETLDEAQRAWRDAAKFSDTPLRWARHIADGLALSILGESAVPPGGDERELEAQRAQIWEALLPTNYCVVVRGFPAERAPELVELLSAEHVAHHQMRIERGRDRRHPAGQFEVLGDWSHIDRDQARRRALVEWGVDSASIAGPQEFQAVLAGLSDDERKSLESDAWAWLAHPWPISGLERACDQLLSDADRAFEIDETRGLFHFRRDRSIRARQSRSYFLHSHESAPPPIVRTTFDVSLARQVRLALDDAMETHKPAVAMAIVVELATGDVLAVDARSAYHLGGFAPLFHEFTPGSTFKVNVMACALESGAVHPGDQFDVGNRSYRLGKRTIHEAESSKTGVLTAAECLAHSVNAGLAQIGVQVPDTFLRGKMIELGYAAAPRTGLGGEREGYLPALPWKRDWTHASISFGHELKVTLWQHAAGLAAIVRGGERVPLRVLESVEQLGARYTTERPAPVRVFSAEVCEQVRAMMRLGAQEGTGRVVARRELAPEIEPGSKTGTAEKVRTELCVHIELAHNAEHHKAGTRCSRDCRQRLKSLAKSHGTCYTSSMCLWGSRVGDTREVMVLVVVDEPRGKAKFGSGVAGPTAMRILREALGVTRHGEALVDSLLDGFAPSNETTVLSPDAPWAQEGW
jgi:cell division protein FtsI/penicillin-binding protein 2